MALVGVDVISRFSGDTVLVLVVAVVVDEEGRTDTTISAHAQTIVVLVSCMLLVFDSCTC